MTQNNFFDPVGFGPVFFWWSSRLVEFVYLVEFIVRSVSDFRGDGGSRPKKMDPPTLSSETLLSTKIDEDRKKKSRTVAKSP
jgi:hypothetical protein